MRGRYLLDTNAAIALLKGDPALEKILEHETSISISVVAVGELYYGAQKSHRVAENLESVEKLADHCQVLSCDLEVARWFGRIKNRLRAKGRPIPINDLWIVATAFSHELTLLTDDRHFTEVGGVRLKSWRVV